MPTRVKSGVESLLDDGSKPTCCLITWLTCYLLTYYCLRMRDEHNPLVSRFPCYVEADGRREDQEDRVCVWSRTRAPPFLWLVSLFISSLDSADDSLVASVEVKNPQTHPRSILFCRPGSGTGVESLLDDDSKPNCRLITGLTCYIYLHTITHGCATNTSLYLVSRFPCYVEADGRSEDQRWNGTRKPLLLFAVN